MNKPHTEIATQQIYSFMNEKEQMQVQEEKYRKEHYRKVAMPHHELQQIILMELKMNHGSITLEYII